MNRFENWFCASSFWRGLTEKQVLPWLLAEITLGEHVLEIGAGAGAATDELRKRTARVTSLEYSQNLVTKLATRRKAGDEKRDSTSSYDEPGQMNEAIVRGDAGVLPFRSETFSAVMAVLMLHHLRSREAQNQALRESFRVLRPGGVFLALEIENNWLHRIAHIRSTFVPFARDEVPARFSAAGFNGIGVAERGGVFRMEAYRPLEIGN